MFHYGTIYLLTYRNGLYLHVDGIFRVSSGQGKVREIPDFAKVREKSGNFVEGQGEKRILGKVREKSGNLHLVQSR